AKKRKLSRDISTPQSKRGSRKSDVTPLITESKDEVPKAGEFELKKISGLMMDKQQPDYEKINEPMSFFETGTIGVSLERSRRTWLTGCMFEKYWTRPQRGRKSADIQHNSKEKMAKLGECKVQIGPHFFEWRLFTVRDDSYVPKEEPKPRPVASTSLPPTSTALNMASTSVSPHAVAQPVNQIPIPSATVNSSAAPAQTQNVTATQTQSPSTHSQTSPTNAQSTTAIPQVPRLNSQAPHANPQGFRANMQTHPHPPAPRPQVRTANDELVAKLHAMARADPNFDILLKAVASGNQTQEQMRRFHAYLNDYKGVLNNKSQNTPSQAPYGSSSPIVSRPKLEPRKKEIIRDQMLIFEFKDNPTDRYLFPKKSLLKIASDGSITATLLLLAGLPRDTEEPKMKKKAKDNQNNNTKSDTTTEKNPSFAPESLKAHTPITIKFFNVSRKQQEMMIRSVASEEDSKPFLQKLVAETPRTQNWWVYYKLGEPEVELLDKLIEAIGNNNPNAKKKPPPNKDMVSGLCHFFVLDYANGITRIILIQALCI
ncbi:hypothetical protein V1514DRAFT_356047, partial [Lipomyces japonicus]|uniref:uncharacterized protein n=1 Tax=Lipomyces japonicus TaxID=56871 RepID=UPI0034CDA8E4